MSLVSSYIGFLLGKKHSLVPENVIAVATTAGNKKKILRSTLTGVYWGFGHTCTLFLRCIRLVILGPSCFFTYRQNIRHDHEHE
ncbi:hypothetical protein [Peribacillus butanolivorans]